jgi:diguanylate cyclase (GGDEF)-like protein
MLSTTESLYSEVSILDVRRFPNVDALRNAAEATSTPSLLLVDTIELNEVLMWLDDKDDVCLRDSPAELIAHRVKCLRLGVESMLDPLTRVLSRQRLDQSLCRATLDASSNQPISLILGDLDHFKSINDQFGHQVGDEILCLVAAALRQHCDRSASVGRIGGEEFAVVCHRDAGAAMMLADELCQKVKGCQTDEGVSATISFGIATTKRPMDGHKLMQCADQALYSAKAIGRDCCVSYGDMEASCRTAGHDVDVVGLENQARVLADRVASFITMRSRKLISTVRKEADIDGLTQCFNRRYLDRRLGDEFDSRNDRPLTVAFLDLDHFGQVNKQFGWPTGDKLLVEVCDTLRSHMRTTDWIGRYGGEEFCVVMPNTTQAEAKAILSRVRKAVEMTEFTSTTNEPVRMTLSIGAATAITADTSHVDLLDRASVQALNAKRSGRNQLCLAE